MMASVPAFAPMHAARDRRVDQRGATLGNAGGDRARLRRIGGGHLHDERAPPAAPRAARRRPPATALTSRDDGTIVKMMRACAAERRRGTAPTWRRAASSGSAAAGATSWTTSGYAAREQPPRHGRAHLAEPDEAQGPAVAASVYYRLDAHRSPPRRMRRDLVGHDGRDHDPRRRRHGAGPLLVGAARLVVAAPCLLAAAWLACRRAAPAARIRLARARLARAGRGGRRDGRLSALLLLGGHPHRRGRGRAPGHLLGAAPDRAPRRARPRRAAHRDGAPVARHRRRRHRAPRRGPARARRDHGPLRRGRPARPRRRAILRRLRGGHKAAAHARGAAAARRRDVRPRRAADHARRSCTVGPVPAPSRRPGRCSSTWAWSPPRSPMPPSPPASVASPPPPPASSRSSSRSPPPPSA